MYRCFAAGLIVMLGGMSAQAAPMFPGIVDTGFSFRGGRAANADTHIPMYSWNGTGADTLLIPKGLPGDEFQENEVFAYTSLSKGVSLPIYEYLSDDPNWFGGDLYLNLRFDGTDVDPNSPLSVSLTGTGNNDPNDGIAQYDLEIWGTLGAPGSGVTGLLLGMDITEASLYGYAAGQNYTLEAIGVIMESEIPLLKAHIDEYGSAPGAMTGALFNPVFPVLFPEDYDPVGDPRYDTFLDIEVAYAGEAGAQMLVPEPTTYLMTVLGGVAYLLRRRRR